MEASSTERYIGIRQSDSGVKRQQCGKRILDGRVAVARIHLIIAAVDIQPERLHPSSILGSALAHLPRIVGVALLLVGCAGKIRVMLTLVDLSGFLGHFVKRMAWVMRETPVCFLDDEINAFVREDRG